MAQLPPDGTWLMQLIGEDVVLFHRHTEEELARWANGDLMATMGAQKLIHDLDVLDAEQKAMASFWSGYFYAHSSA